MMDSICKTIAIILFVLALIGSIVLGSTTAEYRGSFNFTVFLYGVLASGIVCMLIYAIGEIISQLAQMNGWLSTIHKAITDLGKENTKDNDKNYRESHSIFGAGGSLTVNKDHEGRWICSKCGTKNEATAPYCKDCGTYK